MCHRLRACHRLASQQPRSWVEQRDAVRLLHWWLRLPRLLVLAWCQRQLRYSCRQLLALGCCCAVPLLLPVCLLLRLLPLAAGPSCAPATAVACCPAAAQAPPEQPPPPPPTLQSPPPQSPPAQSLPAQSHPRQMTRHAHRLACGAQQRGNVMGVALLQPSCACALCTVHFAAAPAPHPAATAPGSTPAAACEGAQH